MAGYPWLTAQIAREAFMSLRASRSNRITRGLHRRARWTACARTLCDGDFAGSASAAQEADARAVVLLNVQELETEIGQPRDLAPLRRSDEVDPRGLPPRHRRPYWRTATDWLGVGRARGAHMDEFLCGRGGPSPRATGIRSNQRPVVQRRQLCAVTGRRGGRATRFAAEWKELRRRQRRRFWKNSGFRKRILGRFRKRRRDQPLHPPPTWSSPAA